MSSMLTSIAKMIGSICVLSGSIGGAYCVRQQVCRRYRLVKEWDVILTKLEHSLFLEFMPVIEIMRELSCSTRGEWQRLFTECRKRMEQEEGVSFVIIWETLYKEFCCAWELQAEENALFTRIENILLCEDKVQMKAEIEYAKKERGYLEKKLEQKKKEVEKISMVAGVAIGLVSVMLLN